MIECRVVERLAMTHDHNKNCIHNLIYKPPRGDSNHYILSIDFP